MPPKLLREKSKESNIEDHELREKIKEPDVEDREPRIGFIEWANTTTHSHILLAGFQAVVGTDRPKRIASAWMSAFEIFRHRT